MAHLVECGVQPLNSRFELEPMAATENMLLTGYISHSPVSGMWRRMAQGIVAVV
jgi:hypothetical protein